MARTTDYGNDCAPGVPTFTRERLANRSYETWRDILTTHSDSIDRALAAYIARLRSRRGLSANTAAGVIAAAPIS